jgi:hypothetical protein
MLALLFTMLSVFPAGKVYRTVTVADGIYAFISPESNSRFRQHSNYNPRVK